MAGKCRTVVAVAILVMTQAAAAQMKPKPTTSPQPASPAPAPHIPVETARRISRAEAIRLSKIGQAVFVDVRSRRSYETAHIAGAISVPQSQLPQLTPTLPRNKTLITYCACEEEHTAALSVLYFNTKGINNTAALVGGWKGWVSAGLPTQAGPR